ncbi:MAG TPA: cbb3-type cytochrome oxidase assembly protein CcoS [Gallionella sp.]|nr:cbb3-type cytochrome oxidase assembly protein CcoS [Gallionella sp.]
MEVIYGLIPGMMFFGVIFVVVLVWAVRKGQYEDMEGGGNRILMDDDEDMMPHPTRRESAAKRDADDKTAD